jgi:hypothetical protein
MTVALTIGPALAAERPARLDDPHAAPVAGALARDVQCYSPDLVLYSQMSGIWTRTTEIVEDETRWCELWGQFYNWVWPAPECDTTLVDFDTHVAVVVGLGARPNLCYGMALPFVCESPKGTGHFEVTVLEGVPGPRCACGMALVQPLAVIAIERPVDDVAFKRRVQVYDCDLPDDREP